MESNARRRHGLFAVLYILAVLVYVVALIAPPTRRIARSQAEYLLPGERHYTASLRHLIGDDTAYGPSPAGRAFAAAHPDDEAVQMSLAMRQAAGAPGNDCLGYFRALSPLLDRFPDSAVVRAAMVRYGSAVRYSESGATQTDWAQLARATEEGERLEPENTFYPLMAGWALQQRGRETEAVQALLRAGKCSNWDDHVREEIQGMWRLSELGDTQPDGLNRITSSSAILFPHLAGIREFAKAAAEHASKLEASGNTEQGLAIRHALMQSGGLMRSQSTSLIGNLVGVSIVRIAATNPGGTNPQANQSVNGKTAPAVAQAYERYLTKTGHGTEIAFVRSQFVAAEAVSNIMSPDNPEWDLNTLIMKPIRGWVNVQVLLCCTLLMLLCAFVLGVLKQMGWAEPDKRIPWLERILTTFLAGVVILGPTFYLANRLVQPARWWQGMFNPETDIGPVVWVVALVLMAVPIVLKVVLIIGAFIRRRPLTSTVVSGFHRAALPLAAFMLLCYCDALVHLAGRDREMAKATTSQVQHEGRYYADRDGKPWPD